jgi:AmmeMemoRadiSam system protein B
MPALSVREPAVTGMFYPGNARELASTVDALLGKRVESSPTVRAMVVPHAGYTYSGAIAARAFARIASPSRAFIIGPSHVEAFNHTSVYDGTAYRTPLGEMKIDEEAARVLGSFPTIRNGIAGHVLPRGRGEHAIEVELPFLQRVNGNTRLIPIIMGNQSWEACEGLGIALSKVVDWNRDVVIASSDLSHFYDDARARELDGAFCERLGALDAKALHDSLQSGECEACGGGPVVAVLIACAGLNDRSCEIVATGNSGDVSGDRSSVVGYVSAVITA